MTLSQEIYVASPRLSVTKSARMTLALPPSVKHEEITERALIVLPRVPAAGRRRLGRSRVLYPDSPRQTTFPAENTDRCYAGVRNEVNHRSEGVWGQAGWRSARIERIEDLARGCRRIHSEEATCLFGLSVGIGSGSASAQAQCKKRGYYGYQSQGAIKQTRDQVGNANKGIATMRTQ
ncbi:hypothetical protein B0J17DRAFT_631691 [Rhizoctonia solani]|nr:hypothetical protein B0J17DRAFT_631691 [Rhizoctonia solani]